MPFRLLDHTADIGIEATAASLAGLFVACAEGLRQVLCSTPVGAEGQAHSVTLSAHDREELLVAWLSEILGLFARQSLFPLRFHIDRIDATSLSGSVFTERFDVQRHPLNGEIKGVTYHQLRVEEDPARGWRARIYLDL